MSAYHELDAKARDALEAARQLPNGPARSLALKEAGLLRVAADKLRPKRNIHRVRRLPSKEDPMPRYHFPIVNGVKLEDPVGIELANEQQAQNQARAIARQLSLIEDSKESRNVVVVDDDGTEIDKVPVPFRHQAER